MQRYCIYLLLGVSLLFAGRKQICLDPGHGGVDPGTVNESHGANGPYEKDFNLEIALICYDDLFWGLGYSVIMTRFTDTLIFRKDRAKMANGQIPNPYTGAKDTCDILVCIHNNGVEDSTAHGTETWYWDSADSLLAYRVQSNMYNYISNLPYAQDRGLRKKGFTVLRKAKCPACLTECAFVTHDIATNAQWFQLKENQGSFKNKIAWGIDNGIDIYYGFGPRPSLLRILILTQKQSSLQMVWSPCPAGGVTGYNIYRRTYPNSHYEQIAVNVPDTVYSDNTISPGDIYSYYVKGRRSSGQESIRSNIGTAQVPPFSSDCPNTTGLNTGRKIVFDAGGDPHLTWTNQDCIWFCLSTDYGNNWTVARRIDYGWQPAMDFDSQDEMKICYISTLGVPDSAAQETLTYTVSTAWQENDILHDAVLYETYDSILSVSFAIDQHDTGWVVFNTYDDEANNELKIGQFYTQSEPESLENVVVLDTYIRHGLAAVAVRQSDRSIWVVYERTHDVICKWRDNMGTWHTAVVAKNAGSPCISVSGNEIHIVWEQHFVNSDERKIRTLYNSGLGWSRIQTIATVTGRNCYPYIADGAVAVWADIYKGQWDVFSSRRNKYSVWTTPQNISQTPADSRYPQVATYITTSDTNLVYVWTEGNEEPYEIKTHSTTDNAVLDKDHQKLQFITMPSPVKDRLKIRFHMPCQSEITMKLYDVVGRNIALLYKGRVKPGINEISHSCNDLPSGVYFVQLKSNDVVITEKIIIQR